jgi:hypothetical protein
MRWMQDELHAVPANRDRARTQFVAWSDFSTVVVRPVYAEFKAVVAAAVVERVANLPLPLVM